MSLISHVTRHRSRINFDRKEKKSQSRTQQQFRKDADINNIMAKYQKTGQIDYLSRRQPMYADFANLGDFHQNMTLVARAKQSFAELPARIRDRFNNDPAALLKFIENPNNKAEAIELGIIAPEKAPENPSPEPGAPSPKAPAAPTASNPGAPAVTPGA